MGGGASRSPWATLEKTVQGDDKWKTFCDTFTITEKEQQAFWSLWARMDRKKTGEVNAETFRKTWYLLPSSEVSDESNREVILRWFLSLDKDAVPGAENRLYFRELCLNSPLKQLNLSTARVASLACLLARVASLARSSEEFAIGAFTFGTERLDGLVEWTFSMFDTDESGSISVTEFVKMTELMGLSARKALKLQPFLDRDRSGRITIAEFRSVSDASSWSFSDSMIHALGPTSFDHGTL